MTIVAPFILSTGALVRCGRHGGGEAKTEAGCWVALKAPRGLHTHGHPATQRSPALRTPGLLQDHDRQGAGQRERPQLPGYQSEYVWKFGLTTHRMSPALIWPFDPAVCPFSLITLSSLSSATAGVNTHWWIVPLTFDRRNSWKGCCHVRRQISDRISQLVSLSRQRSQGPVPAACLFSPNAGVLHCTRPPFKNKSKQNKNNL